MDVSNKDKPEEGSIAHDAVTLALAKKESAHHNHGMKELYETMRKRPMLVNAYPHTTTDNHTNTCHADDANDNATTSKTKVVHFLRHGQGWHNLMADLKSAQGIEWEQFKHSPENPYVMPEVTDAPLTQKGRDQARAVQPIVKKMQVPPQLVVLSSNCRALQTGLIAFEHLLVSSKAQAQEQQQEHEEPVPFMAHEMLREETGVHVCDCRRPKSQQQLDFPHVNFDLIDTEEDQLFRTDRRETKMEIGERIYQFLEWLMEQKEEHVAVTSHSGWLMTLFNGVVECDEELKPWFQTGELRSVKLEFIRK